MKSSYDKLVFSPHFTPPQAVVDGLTKQGVDIKHLTPARPKPKQDSFLMTTPNGSEMRACQLSKFGILAKATTPEANRARPSRKRKRPQLSTPISICQLDQMSHHIDKSIVAKAKKTPRRSQVGVMKESSSAHFETGVVANWSHSIGHCLGGGETKENLEPATRATNLAIYAAVERPIKESVSDKDLKVDFKVTTIHEEFTVPSLVIYESNWAHSGSPCLFSESTLFSPSSKESITPRTLKAMMTIREAGLAEMNSTLPLSASMR